MAECIIIVNGGSGVGSDDLTAQKSHVLKGYTYVGKDTNDESGVGDIEIKHSHTHDPSVAGQLGVVGNQLYARFPSAYYQVENGVNPYVYVSFADLASVLGVEANKMLTTETIAGVTGTIPVKGAVSKTLTSGETYTIAAGYHNGSGKIKDSVWTGWKQICKHTNVATSMDSTPVDAVEYPLGDEFKKYNTFIFRVVYTTGTSSGTVGTYTYQDTFVCTSKADDTSKHTITPNKTSNKSDEAVYRDLEYIVGVSDDAVVDLSIYYDGESETTIRYGNIEVVLIAALTL